jgi:hypothetical protein
MHDEFIRLKVSYKTSHFFRKKITLVKTHLGSCIMKPKRSFIIIYLPVFLFILPLHAQAKPIFWRNFTEHLEETREELPIQLNDITTLTNLEINKRNKQLIYTYNVDVEHIKRLDIDYIKRSMLTNDCMSVNEKNFDSPVRVIHHHYITNDGSDGFFEMTEQECREGLPLLGTFESWSLAIQKQNEGLPVQLDHLTVLEKITTNSKDKSLIYHHSVTTDTISDINMEALHEVMIESSCSSLEDVWKVPVQKVFYQYHATDNSQNSFFLTEAECKNHNPNNTWEQFEKGITFENKELPSKINDNITLERMTTNPESQGLTYVYLIDIPTVTELLPNIDKLRETFLQNNCKDLSGFLGRPVQIVVFEMYAQDGTYRKTTLTVEECVQGLESLE